MKRIIACLASLLLAGVVSGQGQGPFCGAVGTEGCTAVRFDSSLVVAWATGCVVERGPVDIVNPDGPHAFYGSDSMAVGPAGSNNLVSVSLGDGGTAVLTFGEPICNHPGPDFAVYENSFNDFFLELAFVEVSSDGERYVRFPATSLTPDSVQVGSTGRVDPTMINNLAGKYRVGYGTPFDLDELCDSSGIDIYNITHVRLVDVVGTIDPQYATYDAFGHIVNDPYPTNEYAHYGSGGFDLSGVAVLGEATNGLDEVREAAIRLWPNPATDHLTVSGAAGNTVELYDMAGRRLGCWEVASDRWQMSTTGLIPGVYMLRVDGSAHRFVKK